MYYRLNVDGGIALALELHDAKDPRGLIGTGDAYRPQAIAGHRGRAKRHGKLHAVATRRGNGAYLRRVIVMAEVTVIARPGELHIGIGKERRRGRAFLHAPGLPPARQRMAEAK